MATKGTYAKGIARRDQILHTALEVFAERGYRGTSLRDIAAAAGLSHVGLLHYFNSKEELYAEIIRTRDEVARANYGEGDELETVLEAMSHNDEVPGLAKLFTTLSAAASEPEHPAHEFFANRYEEMRRGLEESIAARQARGEVGTRLDPAKAATVILAAADGLQLQWNFNEELDMGEHMSYLWDVLSSFPTDAKA